MFVLGGGPSVCWGRRKGEGRGHTASGTLDRYTGNHLGLGRLDQVQKLTVIWSWTRTEAPLDRRISRGRACTCPERIWMCRGHVPAGLAGSEQMSSGRRSQDRSPPPKTKSTWASHPKGCTAVWSTWQSSSVCGLGNQMSGALWTFPSWAWFSGSREAC